MLVESVIFSIIIGFARKGRISNLDRISLKYPYLFIVSVLLFGLVCSVAASRGSLAMVRYARMTNIIEYVGLLTAMLLNLNIREMWLAMAGTFMNFLAIVTNGGVMPMSPDALRRAGMPELMNPETVSHMVRHTLSTPETHLKALTDIIGIGSFSFLPDGIASYLREVSSIGDVLVSLAAFMLIQRYMCNPPPEVKEKPA